MRTGLKKHQKITEIYFHEGEECIHIHTYNSDLRKRILKKAERFPEDFVVTDIEDDGSIRADIARGRISFRLTQPYGESHRREISEYARNQYSNGSKLRNSKKRRGEKV